jgi:hypothetical protein
MEPPVKLVGSQSIAERAVVWLAKRGISHGVQGRKNGCGWSGEGWSRFFDYFGRGSWVAALCELVGGE